MKKRKLEGTERSEGWVGGVGGENASDGGCERGVAVFVDGDELW